MTVASKARIGQAHSIYKTRSLASRSRSPTELYWAEKGLALMKLTYTPLLGGGCHISLSPHLIHPGMDMQAGSQKVCCRYLVLDKGSEGVVEGHQLLSLPDQREALTVCTSQRAPHVHCKQYKQLHCRHCTDGPGELARQTIMKFFSSGPSQTGSVYQCCTTAQLSSQRISGVNKFMASNAYTGSSCLDLCQAKTFCESRCPELQTFMLHGLALCLGQVKVQTCL